MSSWDQPNRKSKDHSEYQESSMFLLSHLPWDVLSTAHEGQIPDLKPQEVTQSKLLLTIIFWVNRGMSELCLAHKEVSGQGKQEIRKGKEDKVV